MTVLLFIDLYIIIYVGLDGSMSETIFPAKKKKRNRLITRSPSILYQVFNQFLYFVPVIFKSDQDFFLFQQKEPSACKNERRYNRCTRLFFKPFLLIRISLYIDFFILYLILRKKLLRVLAVCSHWTGE